jgi:hypothetical protein
MVPTLRIDQVDPNGVRMVITCDNQRNARSEKQEEKEGEEEKEEEEEEEGESPCSFDHFARHHVRRYSEYHRGAQGIAV